MQEKHIQYIEISSLNCLLIRFVVCISMISEFDTVSIFSLKNVKCDEIDIYIVTYAPMPKTCVLKAHIKVICSNDIKLNVLMK